jgi:SAM-dependent methyltransferase
MSYIEPLDPMRFRKKNYRNWEAIARYWAGLEELQHVTDLAPVMRSKLLAMCSGDSRDGGKTIVDVGCGSGWIRDLMPSTSQSNKYIGTDYNTDMLNALRERFHSDRDVAIMRWDVEHSTPKNLLRVADVAINAFNFFEIPDIEAAFHNVSQLLKPGGILLVVTIDPLSQIITISECWEELQENLLLYSSLGERATYKKVVDAQPFDSKRVYYGIMYSPTTYNRVAAHSGLRLLEHESHFRFSVKPTLYHIMTYASI